MSPKRFERSTYILFTSACLIALFVFWRPIPRLLWTVEATGFRSFLLAVSLLGWFIALFSTFLIDHCDLFGLRQVYLTAKNKAPAPLRFRTPVLYRLVRHPLYLGFILAFWAPTMTLGHLVFSLATLGYIVVAIQFEERDLLLPVAATGTPPTAWRAVALSLSLSFARAPRATPRDWRTPSSVTKRVYPVPMK